MSEPTLIASFNVLEKETDVVWPTEVYHHVDEMYEMFSITQEDGNTGEFITILLHRDQLVSLAGIAKGH